MMEIRAHPFVALPFEEHSTESNDEVDLDLVEKLSRDMGIRFGVLVCCLLFLIFGLWFFSFFQPCKIVLICVWKPFEAKLAILFTLITK